MSYLPSLLFPQSLSCLAKPVKGKILFCHHNKIIPDFWIYFIKVNPAIKTSPKHFFLYRVGNRSKSLCPFLEFLREFPLSKPCIATAFHFDAPSIKILVISKAMQFLPFQLTEVKGIALHHGAPIKGLQGWEGILCQRHNPAIWGRQESNTAQLYLGFRATFGATSSQFFRLHTSPKDLFNSVKT